MVLEYLNILDGKRDRKRKRVHARITTDHPASSYGLPVVILEDGNCLDYQSWVFLGYRVFSIGKHELPLMKKWLDNLPVRIVPPRRIADEGRYRRAVRAPCGGGSDTNLV